MNLFNEKLAAETALKVVFDLEADNLSSEIKNLCPLWLFNSILENQSLSLSLPSGDVVELVSYFSINSDEESCGIYGLLQSIKDQTEVTLNLSDKAKSDSIETYDTYVVAQDQCFWKLTPTQFIELCKEGVETGGHTLSDTLKMLKTAPKDIKRFGYDCYYSLDKTMLACTPLNWDKDDYANHLKKFGITL